MESKVRSGRFVIEDVRCFAGRQTLEIRPLTFLVGENSTGKSTILGCIQTFSDSLGRYRGTDLGSHSGINFNIPPYKMGAFTDIVRKTEPLTNCFKLSFGFDINNKESIEVTAKFIERQKGSEPVMQEFCVTYPEGKKIILKKETKEKNNKNQKKISEPKINIENNESTFILTLEDDFFAYILRSIFGFRHFMRHGLQEILFFLRHSSISKKEEKDSPDIPKLKKFINSILKKKWNLSNIFDRHYSFAPVRSRPERTYDPVREFNDPEGGGIPILLKNLYRAEKKDWENLKKQLMKFGEASGFFSDIDVKEFGESKGDPFQIQIKVKEGP